MLETITELSGFQLVLVLFAITICISYIIIVIHNMKLYALQKRTGIHSIGLYIRKGKENLKQLRNHNMKKAWSEIRLVTMIIVFIGISASSLVFFTEGRSLNNRITELQHMIEVKDATIASNNLEITKINTEYNTLYDAINIPPNIGGFDVAFDELDNVPIGCPIEPTSFWVSSYFGVRLNPFTKAITTTPHSGIDLVGPMKAQVMTAGTGVVTFTGWDPKGIYGRMIIIDHQNGFETLYAHLSRIYVDVGETVTLDIDKHPDGTIEYHGTVIGRQGTTGLTTGAHLHYGIRWRGEWINPMLFIAAYINKDPDLVRNIVRAIPENDSDTTQASIKPTIGSYVVDALPKKTKEISQTY